MRLKISHTTEYSYEEPVQYSLQRLRLTPLTQPGQTVINWDTKVEGAKMEVGYVDHFGNSVDLVSVNGDQHKVKIVASGEVETEDRAGVYGPHQTFGPLWLFLRETPLTKPGKLVRELVKSAAAETDLALMHALMQAIHTEVAYKTGETGTGTTAEQALEQKSGVCQDHAHILISAARLLDIPARYVSGYLMMEGTAEQAASHAWAEVHLRGLGWVGFDPANNMCPDERYVRIACGLDYRDAAPVSGMVTGLSAEKLTVVITVEATGQSQSQNQ